ncbi:MFS transporter [Lactococcus nasutitermitis]|uniref:MFS transporter n=1 Tax=Lactococcus nasutitermitis TaxID=1652957 RepID=A0ABV9JFD1_9LACT|nr:MFS transporter [Lactococcus nasutitermitis]
MNEQQKKLSTRAFSLSTVMAGLEGTIVATALPSMMADLHGIQLMSWVVTIFMLTQAVTSPIWNKLSERFGFKEMFITGTSLFIIGSLFEGMSVNMPMLIVARAFMGIGAGAMQQLPYVIFGHLFAAKDRRRAIGKLVASYSLAAIAGPLVGGLIVSLLDWRWVFFINIPIGLYMISQIARHFKIDLHLAKQAIDYLGAFLLSLMVIGIMLAFQMMGNLVINWKVISFLLIGAFLLLIAFVFAESRAQAPIIPLLLFKNPSLMAKNALTFLTFGFFAFYTNYLPTWGQGVVGVTALIGGLILIPGSLLLMLGARSAGWLTEKLGEKMAVSFAVGLMAAGALGLILLPETASILWLFILGGIMGLSAGLVNPGMTVAVQESVEIEHLGAATALNTLIRTLGATIILSAMSVALNQTFVAAIATDKRLTLNFINKIADSNALKSIPSNLIVPLRQVLFDGLHKLAWISFILLLLTLVINIIDPWKKAQR